MNLDEVTIKNNVVDGGPTLHVPAHLSFGEHILDKLKEHSRSGKNDVALINGETGVKITFKQILRDLVNAASALRKLGVKRGDVIALCSENRDEFMPVALAAICCGATVTATSVTYSKDEMKHVLSLSKPNIMICSETAVKTNHAVFKGTNSIKKIIQFGDKVGAKGVVLLNKLVVRVDVDDFEPTHAGASDVIFLLYSSGTTGLPKAVMLTHLNALYGIANMEFVITDIKSKSLTIVPWYHAYGLLSTINNIAVGKTIVYLPGFHPQKYLNAIQEYKVNKLNVVPPLVVFLAKSPIVEKYDLSSVLSVWCGAAPLSAETIEAAMKRLPKCRGIYQAYGMTETALVATKDSDCENAKQKPGSGGLPIRGVKAKIVDIATRKMLGPNQEGEICLKGPIIMKGYLNNEAATREAFDEEGYLKTGDIGYYDGDGYIFIVDRLKELIKYKANQVPPAAVESVLLQHSFVAECGVVGRPDEAAGELPTAFVTLKPGATVTEKELLEFANSRLSPEKRLYGGVIFVNEIPKNPSGKILRRILKQQLIKINKKKSKL